MNNELFIHVLISCAESLGRTETRREAMKNYNSFGITRSNTFKQILTLWKSSSESSGHSGSTSPVPSSTPDMPSSSSGCNSPQSSMTQGYKTIYIQVTNYDFMGKITDELSQFN